MKTSNIKKLLPVLLGAVLLTRCSCDFFGSAGALFVSENDEVELGKEFDRQLNTVDSVKAEYPIYVANTPEKVAFQKYVKGLADEIVAAIPTNKKPGYDFHFTLIDKDIENAFAVPGGYVYIYTGIIKKMQDESELSGVLSHEIAHITMHHYRDAMAKDASFSILLQALFGNSSSQLTQLVAGSIHSLAALQVTSRNEAEADEVGTENVGRINRNPLGIAKFFSRYASGGLLAWISTHPDPPNRVRDVTAEVNASTSLKAIAADSATTNYKSRFVTNTAVLPR
jgi:beta-barrel assembly-enhancing protease